MKTTFHTFVMTFLSFNLAHAADSGGKVLVLKSRQGLAIQGYDPVAYFTDNKPVKGNPKFQSEYDGARYLFPPPKINRVSIQILPNTPPPTVATAAMRRALIVSPRSAQNGSRLSTVA